LPAAENTDQVGLQADRPVSACGTLHHCAGEHSPHSIMAHYIDALPSGSYVAISHFCDPETNPS
jgi:hypothetical protein